MSTATDRAHSVPPTVYVEAAGADRDIPVIVLDLEADNWIAKSIVRRLATSLARARRTHLLALIAAQRTSMQDDLLVTALGLCRARETFQISLTHDAALALYESLGEQLDVAETECDADGCHAVGVLGGKCGEHHEAADGPLRLVGA